MSRSSIFGGIVLLLAIAGSTSAQVTTRVSLATGGAQGNSSSYAPALSASGRFVAFESEASNLVPGDLNGLDDVFLRDRRTGTTIRVSLSSSGVEGNGDSDAPAISKNGRFVAYSSEATNLVAGDTNAARDVFLYDAWTATTSRVSVSSAGTQGDDQSLYPSLSADGRFVAFHSFATNLVLGDTNAASDVFVHDTTTGTTTRVSVDSAGGQADDRSEGASISADGALVAFTSWASNLVPGDLNGGTDVFVRDLVNGTTTCASLDSSGVPSAGCGSASISGNGLVVGFVSWSPNLVAGDSNNLTDVFVRNLAAGVTKRVSVSSSGAQGNGISQLRAPALSHDGRFVAFKSFANNLVPGDTNAAQDIFVHDCRFDRTQRVSVDSQGLQANGPSSQPTISANGRFAGFYSNATNLVPGDTNTKADAFVRKLW